MLVTSGEKTHRLSDTFAEDGEDEDGRDGRGEVTGDRLDVVEELAALGRLHDGDPRDAHPDEDDDENSAARQGWRFKPPHQAYAAKRLLPAGDHQLLLTGPFPDFSVDVHREQRAGAVEDGG